MACSGCEERRKIARQMVAAARRGDHPGMRARLREMASSAAGDIKRLTGIGEEPQAPQKVQVRVRPAAAKQYSIDKLTKKYAPRNPD